MAWYVVYRGKVPGVYQTWAQCNAQVCGFSGNSHQSFATREEAEASYLQFIQGVEHPLLVEAPDVVVNQSPYLFYACVMLVVLLLVVLVVVIIVYHCL